DEGELAVALERHQLVESARGLYMLGREVSEDPALDLGERQGRERTDGHRAVLEESAGAQGPFDRVEHEQPDRYGDPFPVEATRILEEVHRVSGYPVPTPSAASRPLRALSGCRR